MGSRVRIGALVLVCVVALAATGCGNIAEKAVQGAVEGATGVKVENDGTGVTVTGNNGEQVTLGGGEDLPEGMPADFPVYAGTPAGGAKADTAESTGFTYVINTADGAKTVADWYKSELKKAGWETQVSVHDDAGSPVTASIVAKKGKADATLVIGEESDKTSITGMLNIKK